MALGGPNSSTPERTGAFVTPEGEIWERASGPGSAIPLSDTLVSVVQELAAAGEETVDVTLPFDLANSGAPDGPLGAFSTGLGLHSIRIRGKIAKPKK